MARRKIDAYPGLDDHLAGVPRGSFSSDLEDNDELETDSVNWGGDVGSEEYTDSTVLQENWSETPDKPVAIPQVEVAVAAADPLVISRPHAQTFTAAPIGAERAGGAHTIATGPTGLVTAANWQLPLIVQVPPLQGGQRRNPPPGLAQPDKPVEISDMPAVSAPIPITARSLRGRGGGRSRETEPWRARRLDQVRISEGDDRWQRPQPAHVSWMNHGTGTGTGTSPVVSPSSWPPRYCFNCGQSDHYYKKCPNPVTSYGMILYQISPGAGTGAAPVIRYLMVQRDFSPEFRSLITNFRFYEHQPQQINYLGKFLTQIELRALATYDYPTLYSKINRFYLGVKKNSKHQQILQSIQRQPDLLAAASRVAHRLTQLPTTDHPLEPDWGFPKGRRNKHHFESDLSCAQREVAEETGLFPERYSIVPDLLPREIYFGTNQVAYQHIYYVGRIDGVPCPVYYNPLNPVQTCEIRKIGWFTFEEAHAMIRDYHVEKRQMLEQLHRTLLRRHACDLAK